MLTASAAQLNPTLCQLGTSLNEIKAGCCCKAVTVGLVVFSSVLTVLNVCGGIAHADRPRWRGRPQQLAQLHHGSRYFMDLLSLIHHIYAVYMACTWCMACSARTSPEYCTWNQPQRCSLGGDKRSIFTVPV